MLQTRSSLLHYYANHSVEKRKAKIEKYIKRRKGANNQLVTILPVTTTCASQHECTAYCRKRTFALRWTYILQIDAAFAASLALKSIDMPPLLDVMLPLLRRILSALASINFKSNKNTSPYMQ